MNSMQDFDRARYEAALVVRDVLRDRWPGERSGDESDAFEIIDKLIYDRPDLVVRLSERARRAWWYSRDSMSDTKVWPLFYQGGDEFYNRTLAFRVPFSGTVVLALNVPLRRLPVPVNVEDPYEWLRESGPASVLERVRVRDLAGRVVPALRARARRVRRPV